jgi:hypothetical protein
LNSLGSEINYARQIKVVAWSLVFGLRSSDSLGRDKPTPER